MGRKDAHSIFNNDNTIMSKIKTLLNDVDTTDACEIVNDLYAYNYSKILSNEFNILIKNDHDICNIINTIYKYAVMRCLEKTVTKTSNGNDVNSITDIKEEINKVYDEVIDQVNSIRTNVVSDLLNGGVNGIYYIKSSKFKQLFKSEVIRCLNDKKDYFRILYEGSLLNHK